MLLWRSPMAKALVSWSLQRLDKNCSSKPTKVTVLFTFFVFCSRFISSLNYRVKVIICPFKKSAIASDLTLPAVVFASLDAEIPLYVSALEHAFWRKQVESLKVEILKTSIQLSLCCRCMSINQKLCFASNVNFI